MLEASSELIADNNSISQAIVEGNCEDKTMKKFLLAVITNSSQIRLVDDSFSCTALDGHTDIVLAADVSPDGYAYTEILLLYFSFLIFQYCFLLKYCDVLEYLSLFSSQSLSLSLFFHSVTLHSYPTLSYNDTMLAKYNDIIRALHHNTMLA